MDHFLAILIGLLVALGIVTLVGHGLWVLLAGLFGSTTGSGQAGTKNCPQCGARLLADKCPVCNWPGSMVPRDHTTLVLHAMRDQIDRFARMGLIEPEAHRRLVLALDTERERRESAQTAALVAQIVVVEPEVAAKAPAASPLLAVPPMVAQLATPPVAAAQSATVTPALPVHALDMDYPVVAAQPQAAAAFGRPLPDGRGSHDSGGQTQVAAGAPCLRRAPFSSLLAAFMEEKNIRWGELVGGLLIVCCSIALVVSFWAADCRAAAVEIPAVQRRDGEPVRPRPLFRPPLEARDDKPGGADHRDAAGAAQLSGDYGVLIRRPGESAAHDSRRGRLGPALRRRATGAAGQSCRTGRLCWPSA